MKDVSDSLVTLETIQEFYTTMSDTVKSYDLVLPTTLMVNDYFHSSNG